MADETHDCLATLGLIGLFQSGVDGMVHVFRNAAGSAELAIAVGSGRLPRRGRVLRHFNYRVHGENIIVTFDKWRVEFSLTHPQAFSAYLLQRHIDLNKNIRRSFPQYVALPIARDLDELRKLGLVQVVDDTAPLFELTTAGKERAREIRHA